MTDLYRAPRPLNWRTYTLPPTADPSIDKSDWYDAHGEPDCERWVIQRVVLCYVNRCNYPGGGHLCGGVIVPHVHPWCGGATYHYNLRYGGDFSTQITCQNHGSEHLDIAFVAGDGMIGFGFDEGHIYQLSPCPRRDADRHGSDSFGIYADWATTRAKVERIGAAAWRAWQASETHRKHLATARMHGHWRAAEAARRIKETS